MWGVREKKIRTDKTEWGLEMTEGCLAGSSFTGIHLRDTILKSSIDTTTRESLVPDSFHPRLPYFRPCYLMLRNLFSGYL